MQDYAAFGVTIANGASLSGAVDLRGYVPYGIEMPAAWTAAGLSFEVSSDGINFVDLYDSTGEYTLSATAGTAIGFPGANVFTGFKYMKVRSGTSGTPVNQGADRVLKILCKSE